MTYAEAWETLRRNSGDSWAIFGLMLGLALLIAASRFVIGHILCLFPGSKARGAAELVSSLAKEAGFSVGRLSVYRAPFYARIPVLVKRKGSSVLSLRFLLLLGLQHDDPWLECRFEGPHGLPRCSIYREVVSPILTSDGIPRQLSSGLWFAGPEGFMEDLQRAGLAPELRRSLPARLDRLTVRPGRISLRTRGWPRTARAVLEQIERFEGVLEALKR